MYLSVCPHAVLRSAYHLADTLPILFTDPLLRPFLADPARWPALPSPTLADAARAFPIFTAMPTFTDAAYHAEAALVADPRRRSAIAALVDPDTSRPTLARLHHAAQLHLQHRLILIAAAHALSRLLDPTTSPLRRLAIARIRAAGAPFAGALLLAFRLSRPAQLSDAHLAFYLAHRFGLAHPTVPWLRLTRCHHRCTVLTAAHPAAGDHPLAYAAPHAYHQMRCWATNSRTQAHNALTTALASTLRTDAAFHHDYVHLSSSTTTTRQIDCRLTHASRARPLALDTTLTLPSPYP